MLLTVDLHLLIPNIMKSLFYFMTNFSLCLTECITNESLSVTVYFLIYLRD